MIYLKHMLKRSTKIALIVGVLALVVLVVIFRDRVRSSITSRLPPIITIDQGTTVKELTPEGAPEGEIQEVTSVATGLDTPWAIAFMPDKSMLVTERGGVLHKLPLTPDGLQGADGEGGWKIQIPGTFENDEGGLLGLALHPNFEENKYIYFYVTTNEGGQVRNRVDRYRLEGDKIEGKTTIVQGIPGSKYHDGGRIAFGPDGKLYATTGDAGDANNAQNVQSLAGKILRINDDGTVPGDNPFNSPVWSYGHRNPQGIAWDRRGRLWATEHGRSGVRSGLDELNLIEKGKNYGWPTIQGDQERDGMLRPAVHSGELSTWAPAGMAAVGESLFFAGLRGESLYEADLAEGDTPKMTAHFFREFGRLRAVTLGPDGMLYVSTSNKDGRGSPKEGDDRILRIDPRVFDK